MPRKETNARPSDKQPEATNDIEGLFGSTPDADQFDWNGLDLDALRTLIRAVAGCSGLLSMGGTRDGTGVYLSVRLDKQSKGFALPTVESFNALVGQLTPAWQLKARKLKEQQKL